MALLEELVLNLSQVARLLLGGGDLVAIIHSRFNQTRPVVSKADLDLFSISDKFALRWLLVQYRNHTVVVL